jgi:hypothetical protein
MIKRFEVFKPNTIEYISNAYLCKKVVSEVSLYTDLSGYEHLVEKEVNNKEISPEECEEMMKNKYCEFGTLKKGEHSYHTNNKVASEYPNRFTSLFKSKHYLKENCFLVETKVFSHYNQEHPVNALADMNKCKYLKGRCQIKPNEVTIWEVNQKQNCKFISMGVFDGYYSGDFWINHDNQIALNLLSEYSCACNDRVRLTSEGYALKSVRAKRKVETAQEAGELQYLENNFEKQTRHMAETFCRMFNNNNEVLEILLKENPKKFIQKALNHSAVDVKLLNNSVIEVTFCKEINNNLIQFTDLNDYRDYTPIKIKTYNDKIWYLKDNVIVDRIEDVTQNEITNVKNFEIKEEYGLQFLNDKLIIKEHIFNNRTNVEEELLAEMKQVSNVGIELKENEQNPMIPHEIIEDLDNFFETYWLKYWRIYVTIATSLVYIFIVRSLIYIVSPYFMINKRRQLIPLEPITDSSNRATVLYQSNDEKIKLNPSKRKINSTEFPSIISLDQE